MIFRAINVVASMVLLLAVWLLFPDQLDSGIVRSASSEEVLIPDYLMKDFRYTSTRGQARELEIFAESANFFIEEQRANGVKVDAYFFNNNGEKTKLIGDRGIFYMEKRHLNLTGNVMSVSPDGFEMRGESADYFVDDQRLIAPTRVAGTTATGDIKVWGDRAEGKMDENILWLFGNVLTDYQAPRSALMKIRADRAVLDRDQAIATYYDHVHVDQENTKLTSGEASLYYSAVKNTTKPAANVNSKKGALRYLVAKKDVEIHETAARFSQSQQAEFFADSNSIVLTGFPSVYDGPDTITGDRLTLYRSTGVVEVNSANAAFSEEAQRGKRRSKSSDKLEGEDLELVIDEKPKR